MLTDDELFSFFSLLGDDCWLWIVRLSNKGRGQRILTRSSLLRSFRACRFDFSEEPWIEKGYLSRGSVSTLKICQLWVGDSAHTPDSLSLKNLCSLLLFYVSLPGLLSVLGGFLNLSRSFIHGLQACTLPDLVWHSSRFDLCLIWSDNFFLGSITTLAGLFLGFHVTLGYFQLLTSVKGLITPFSCFAGGRRLKSWTLFIFLTLHVNRLYLYPMNNQ